MAMTKCKICRSEFTRRSMTHKCCSVECSIAFTAKERERKAKIEKKQERKIDKERKEKLKTRADWMREAQIAFNQYIRRRDQLAGYTCISSGRPLHWSGNQVDAGHYRSVGSAPHLRFNEDNVHAQSKHDNQFLSGNAVEYRKGLIARIGLERVETLESDNQAKKYTVEDLKQIKETYKQKLKELG